MLIRKPQDLFSSDITPEHIWRARRHWLARMGGTATGLSLAGAGVGRALAAAPAAEPTCQALAAAPNPRFGTTEAKTPFDDVTSYNNYYEFGLDKGDPARYASALKLEPWTVTVEGEVGKPGTFDIDMLRRLAPMEERVYRLRCVEGWSMVIPWIGYSLSALLKQVEPTGNARYVVHHGLAAGHHAGRAFAGIGLALCRRLTHGRSHASLGDAGVRCVRPYAAAAERRAAAPGRALEIWVQVGQVAGSYSADRTATCDLMGQSCCARIWFLRQRESGSAASSLESGD